MKPSVYPTLTTTGWTKDIGVVVEDIIANAFASNADQSYLYDGNVFSVQKVIADTMPDVPALIDKLENGFKNALETVLDVASVSVTHADEASARGDTAGVRLIISITVNDAIGSFSTGARFEASEGRLTDWIKFNNTGSVN